MTKIDTSTWKEFTLKDLGFSFYHGARLKKTDRIEGDIPFVTAGKENKGIIGKLGNKDISVYHNPITIDMFGNCFYHDFDCAGDDNIYFFVNDNLDNKVKIYISSVINSKIRDLYSYTDQFRQDDAENLTVLLPVKECVEPDFDYMKQYMKDIENRVSVSLTALQEVQGKNKIIDIKEWQSFHLYDIFDIDSGSKLDKVDMNTTKAEINFVGRSNFNNGITEKVKEIEGLKPYEAGNLTLALGGAYLGSCFVQKEKFYTSQNVVVLRPKSAISDYSKQFIATAIFKESQNNYKAFINELNSHIKTDFQIKLPVKTDGSPDYDYMDKYIESVYGGGTLVLNILTQII